MEIIVYTQFDNVKKNKLQSEIYNATNLGPIMVFDFKILFKLLKQKISEEVIIVFLISSVDELDFLISNKEKLFHSRFILILLNDEEDLTSKGLSLYPRYIDIRHAFKEVSAILDNMIRKNIQNGWEGRKRDLVASTGEKT
jgi:hypothetical protein